MFRDTPSYRGRSGGVVQQKCWSYSTVYKYDMPRNGHWHQQVPYIHARGTVAPWPRAMHAMATASSTSPVFQMTQPAHNAYYDADQRYRAPDSTASRCTHCLQTVQSVLGTIQQHFSACPDRSTRSEPRVQLRWPQVHEERPGLPKVARSVDSCDGW